MSNICLSVRSVVFAMELRLFWKLFPMNTADSIVKDINIHQIIECSSPSPVTMEFFVFLALDHSPDSRMILILQRQFQFCFIDSNDELLRSFLFLRIEIIKSPRSVTKCFFVPYGLRGSVEKNFLVIRSNFSCHSPRRFIKSPRSVVRLDLSFPLLRRPSTVE